MAEETNAGYEVSKLAGTVAGASMMAGPAGVPVAIVSTAVAAIAMLGGTIGSGVRRKRNRENFMEDENAKIAESQQARADYSKETVAQYAKASQGLDLKERSLDFSNKQGMAALNYQNERSNSEVDRAQLGLGQNMQNIELKRQQRITGEHYGL